MSKVNAGQAPSTLIPKYIGSDFDKVVSVADNIEQVVIVSDNIEDVGTVADNINYVKEVAEDLHGMPVTMYTGENPPVLNPMPEGVMWYCTTDGRTYVWYTDADSGQWVESAPQSAMKDEATNIFLHSTPSNVNPAYRNATLYSTSAPEAEISVAHNALNTPVVQAQFIREEALWDDVSVIGAQGIVTLMGYSSGNSQLKAEIITWKNGAEGTSLGASQWVTLPSQPSVVSLPVTLANIDVLDAGDSYVVKLTSQMSAGGSAVSTILVDGNTSSRFGIIFNTGLIGLNDGIRDGVTTSAPTENAVYDALQLKVGKSQLVQSGNLTSTANWADVPAYSDSELGGLGGPLNAQAKALTARSELLLTDVREALRRSYAEAGYNLVDGSFEAGGTLVNANDVLLQERTGKAFSGLVGVVAAGTNPASGGFVDVSDVVSNPRSFRSFGATGLGIADDTTALRNAIIWAGSLKGRRVYGTPGDVYRITGELTVHWDGKSLDESSSCIIDFTGTTINVDADNVTALRISRNYVKVYNPSVDSYGSRVGVTAYALAPEDETQTTQKVSQMFCEIHSPVARNCAVGMRFRPGPSIAGQDSGSFYHSIYSPRFQNVTKGFYFARCVSGTNLTTRVGIYSPIHTFGHCAWDIEAADSLSVFGGSAEFINQNGEHAGNPTIKVHKPVSGDSLSSSNIMFLRYYGEVGTTPFDLMSSESISMPGCTFFAYENEGVIAGSYTLQGMFQNEGAIVSRAKHSSDSTPMLAVRRDVGANQGQAYLMYLNRDAYPAQFYADRGFTFESPIGVARIRDLQNTVSNEQIIGSSLARAVIIGNGTTGTFTMLNTSTLVGRGFEFGSCYHIGPDSDNAVTGGLPGKRYSTIYSVNGVQTTSDGRLKTPTRKLDKTDISIGKQIMEAIGWGEWLAESDSNRTHCWVTVQAVIQAFEDHGRNALDYGMVCYDKWDDIPAEIDSGGNTLSAGQVAGDIYSLRHHELALFLVAVNNARLSALEL